uniref:Uncharacterized protein n=1 Tax=Oryza rufipogon TaxID=4529 RepID=A0A0E0NWU5_ORYRU
MVGEVARTRRPAWYSNPFAGRRTEELRPERWRRRWCSMLTGEGRTGRLCVEVLRWLRSPIRGGAVREGARRAAPPRFPTVPPPLSASRVAASPRQLCRLPAPAPNASPLAQRCYRRPRHRTGRPRGVRGGEDPSGRGSRRRGGAGGWGSRGDDREEEEGRGCGGHGRRGWRRLAAYPTSSTVLTPLPPAAPPPLPANASPWPYDAAITSPSDREAAEEAGKEEARVGRVAGETAERSRKATCRRGGAEAEVVHGARATVSSSFSLASATVSSASPLVADRRAFWIVRVGNQVEME